MTEVLIRRFVKDWQKTGEPEVRKGYGQLSGGVGILVNLLLALGKLLAGAVTRSISITADAFNNLSDAGTSIVTLVGFRLAGQKPDAEHPFGHGRMEYLTGLAVSVAILFVGVELAKTSIEKIFHPQEVVFSWLSVAILAVSICAKLWLNRFNRRLSTAVKSAALAATAADSLSDAVATGVLLAGLLAGHLLRLPLDGWLGVGVALFILRSGWQAAKDTIDPLLGQSPDPELVQAIRDTVLSHEQIIGMHDLVIHDYGPGRGMMSLHAEVPLDADIMEAHDVIDHIERELYERYHIQASIHMDPIAVNDQRVTAAKSMVEGIVCAIDPRMTIHDFRMTDGVLHTNLIFDVVVPHGLPLTDEQVKERISQALSAGEETYYAVVQVDHAYAQAEDERPRRAE